MPTIKAEVPIATAAGLLNDPNSVKYKSAKNTDLLRYFNEAQLQIVSIDLQANATRENLLLTPGTKQSITSLNTLGLISVVRNMGRTGSTVGSVVDRMSRAIMDQIYPDWHTATAKEEAKFWIYDPQESRFTFDVYPAAVSSQTHYLEVIHGAIPDQVTNTATEYVVGDEYVPDIVEYILHRAKSVNAEHAARGGEADAHLDKFVRSVRGKIRGNPTQEGG